MTGRARLPVRIMASAAGVVALGSLARADAPAGQYQLFNSEDQTISDLKTGLQWQRYAAYQPTFGGAITYCADLLLAGFAAGSWRVPSYKELLTLVDEAPHTEYPTGAPVQIAIDGNAFPHIAVDAPYWTSSLYAPRAGNAYVVGFTDGAGSYQSMTAAGYVRCVR